MSQRSFDTPPLMRYELRLAHTSETIGWFTTAPAVNSLEDAAAYLLEHPLDDYMHRFLLEALPDLSKQEIDDFLAHIGDNAPTLAVLAEAKLLRSDETALPDQASAPQISIDSSPLIYLRAAERKEDRLRAQWMDILRENMIRHAPLPSQLPPPPMELTQAERARKAVSVRDILADFDASGISQSPSVPLEQTIARASEALGRSGLRANAEMRHESSLSPVALLRMWSMTVRVQCGGLDYTLSGAQTAYGRGFDVASARAAYLMEVVERYSGWASIENNKALGYVQDKPLVRAKYDEFGPGEALDPAGFATDVAYAGQPLYWLEARRPVNGGGETGFYVPAQWVFMFGNYDDPSFFNGLGTTGFAAGNDMEQAKLTGLHECLERDAEGTACYDPDRCFRIDAEGFEDNPPLAALLADLETKGVEVAFQDVTSEYGVPCYKAFAIGPDGTVAKGAAANLNGKRALISALTETPYAYPNGPRSLPAPKGLPRLSSADLPNYSTGSCAGDVALLEKMLAANGLVPAYVDLTRLDLGIPVVRALVSGLEASLDFDWHSRLAPRLAADCLASAQERRSRLSVSLDG